MRKTQLGIIILLVSTFLSAEPALVEPGWNPSVKSKLIEVIKAGKGKNLPVVFDFDNTLVCRDISETTFADMIENGTLSKENVSTNLISNLYNDFSLRQTYDAYLNEKGNEKLRDVGHVNGYAWAVQVMASLNPAQIVNATEKTYAKGASEKLKGPDEHENAPYFYPEMVELVAELIKADYDVWVISASNVWAVRWMVSKVLNEKLLTKGTAKGIDPKQVIGISTLLKRSDGRFFKDSTLTSKNNAYLLLDKNELEKFKLTSHIIHPV